MAMRLSLSDMSAKSTKLGRIVMNKHASFTIKRTKRSTSVSSRITDSTEEEGQMSMSRTSSCSCSCSQHSQEKKAGCEEETVHCDVCRHEYNLEEEKHENDSDVEDDDEDAVASADDGSCCRVDETAEMLEECLEDLQVELEKIDDSLKVSYRMALEKCPDIADSRQHKLLFLRCEEYFVESAAVRLVRYWDKRRALFGDDRAFGEIGTPADTASLRDDYGALEVGMITNTRQTDDQGRLVFYEDSSRLYQLDRKKEAAHKATGVCATQAARRAARFVHRCSFTRAMWYVVHEALLDPQLGETLQRNGMVLVVRKDGVRHSLRRAISCFDRRTFLMIAESLFGCLPVRIEAFHICRPAAFSALMAMPILYMHAPLLRAHMYIHQCGGKVDKTCHWTFEPDAEGKFQCQSEEFRLSPSGSCPEEEEFGFGTKKKRQLKSTQSFMRLARQRDIALPKLLAQVGGLPKTSIPVELGGSLRLDHNAWLQERCRLATEAAAAIREDEAELAASETREA